MGLWCCCGNEWHKSNDEILTNFTSQKYSPVQLSLMLLQKLLPSSCTTKDQPHSFYKQKNFPWLFLKSHCKKQTNKKNRFEYCHHRKKNALFQECAKLNCSFNNAVYTYLSFSYCRNSVVYNCSVTNCSELSKWSHSI